MDKEIESAADPGDTNIKGVLVHGGRYFQYNVYGNLFEVSNKYVPPIRPIGRGAYGFVWYDFVLFHIFCFFLSS